ncbi:4Fe-4S binding protein [Thermoanaerobacter pentosaceus]|uniref:2-oxoglutarate ferredoxin oxidoreductase subunit delta n=1 Tax=Thermoanaerobacter pentosaceus TaxID=694059 RepID=A0ABT9M549_9THEO|nr:4Fe-4S binding protein [Thermoanaerobacter pentosaceus]MDP9751256.1 2-oxoglutarate ferredoxin oxidoreductase subunit delta [Thermoanaerobacter pentosaceus]
MAKVIFNEDLCKGCELCVNACPKKIIEMDLGKINVKGYHPATIKPENMDKCIGCAFCAMMCPDTVITVIK